MATFIGVDATGTDTWQNLYNKTLAQRFAANFKAASVMSAMTNNHYQADFDRGRSATVDVLKIEDITVAGPTLQGTGTGKLTPYESAADFALSDYSFKAVTTAASIEMNLNAYSLWANPTDQTRLAHFDIGEEQLKNVGVEVGLQMQAHLFSVFESLCHAKNKGTAAGAGNGRKINLGSVEGAGADQLPREVQISNCHTLILDCEEVLRRQNVATFGPAMNYMIVPEEFLTYMKKNENLNRADYMGDASSTLRTNRVGSVSNFLFYSTTDVPFRAETAAGTGSPPNPPLRKDSYQIFFGNREAITQAIAFVDLARGIRDISMFASFNMFLMVWGLGAVNPEMIGTARIELV